MILRELLCRRARQPKAQMTPADLLSALDLRPLSDAELAAQVTAAVADLDKGLFATREKMHSYLMGTLMSRLLGRVDGARLSRLIAEKLGMSRDCEGPVRRRA